MADRSSTVRVGLLVDSSGASAKLGVFARGIGKAALGTAALVAGGVIATDKLYGFADAADDANARIENITHQMGLFGNQADKVATRIENVAKKTAIQTATDVNSVKATQAKLLTFKAIAATADQMGGNFDRATNAAIDLAAAGFGTAETNAVQLGKALQDPVKGLTSLARAGVTFTDQEKERIKTLVESNRQSEAQNLILKAIEQQVGGTAAATAGGYEKMKIKLQAFGQELAQKALPYLDRFGDFMDKTGGPAIERFATQVGDRAAPYLKRFGNFVQEVAQRDGPRLSNWLRKDGVPALERFSGWVQDHVVPAIRNYLTPALQGARDFFDKVAKSVHKNEPELRDMGEKIEKLANFVLDDVMPALGKFAKFQSGTFGTAVAGYITFLSNMYDGWKSLFNIIGSVVSRIQDVIDKLDSLKDHASHIPGGGIIGGLLGRTTGGGDGGGFSPFFTANGNPFAKQETNIYFSYPVTDPQAVASAIDRVMRRRQIAFGGTVTG